jgi:hypothetical protein
MSFLKKAFSGNEDFAGQISDRGLKSMLDQVGLIKTEVLQFIEPHHVSMADSFRISNLLGEFTDPAVGIVHGQGGGRAFIRVDALKDIARANSGQIRDYATLVKLFREKGLVVKRVKYFEVE